MLRRGQVWLKESEQESSTRRCGRRQDQPHMNGLRAPYKDVFMCESFKHRSDALASVLRVGSDREIKDERKRESWKVCRCFPFAPQMYSFSNLFTLSQP